MPTIKAPREHISNKDILLQLIGSPRRPGHVAGCRGPRCQLSRLETLPLIKQNGHSHENCSCFGYKETVVR